MLIKESTLRRIIREEARRVLREDAAASSIDPAEWKRLSNEVLTFANGIQSNLQDRAAADKAYKALRDLTEKGLNSSYAKMVSVPVSVANPPAAAGASAPAVAQLACLLSGLVTGTPSSDYNSAQAYLTGTSSIQTDVLSKKMLAALGTFNMAATIIEDIKKIAASQNPSYVAPAPKPMAPAPGAGSFMDSNASSGVSTQVSKGSMNYTLPPQTVDEMSKSMTAVARGQKILRLGSRGSDVTALQYALKTIADQTGGFNAPTVSGTYDAATFTAVKTYQRLMNIVSDGLVGQQTLAQLIGRKSSMTGHAGDKGNYFRGATSRAGTQPMGGAGPNPNVAIVQQPPKR